MEKNVLPLIYMQFKGSDMLGNQNVRRKALSSVVNRHDALCFLK